MIKIRKGKYTMAAFALAIVLAGCKGESPTAPSPSTGGSAPGGGVTPPVSASVNLTASNATPLVDSTSVITATVQQNGAAVPNGTAVEFGTTLGTFADTGTNTTIRTTTGGVATATLTSSAAGTATVTAVVNNVTKTVNVSFQARPVTPPPIDTTPTITSISRTTGRPAGGETLVINGTNFRAPVRVIFTDATTGAVKEAFVVSVTPTQIEVLTPPVDLGAGQTKTANVSVIVDAGTTSEVRVNAASTFTYQAEVLTPTITTTSPNSGPTTGGTRVTIFGNGFQSPAQVFFGSAEAQVLNITFNQIIVVAPPARDTAPAGNTSVTGFVDIRVININSNTNTTLTSAFRYTPGMQITAVGPTEGSYLGGTRVTIDGTGFDDPVAVTVGGVAAQPIKVTGTQIVVMTSPINITACGDVPGPISVTNVETGETGTGPSFTYRVPTPTIISASSGTLGGTISVAVLNAGGIPRFTLGSSALSVTGSTTNTSTGITTYTLQVPSTVTLQTQACSGASGVTSPIPTAFNLTYTNATNGCTDTLPNGVTISPASTGRAVITPTTLTFAATAAKVGPPAVAQINAPAQTATVVNSGGGPLTITGITATGAGCASFSAPPPAPASPLNPCDTFQIGVSYNTQAAGSSATCTFTVLTNANSVQLTLTGTTQ